MIPRKTPLKRSAYSIKRTPIRKRALGKIKADRRYSKQARAFKLANPYCLAGIPPDACNCFYYTQDVHHLQGRGKNYLVETTWLPVCRSCHTYIHNNPGAASKLGLLQ